MKKTLAILILLSLTGCDTDLDKFANRCDGFVVQIHTVETRMFEEEWVCLSADLIEKMIKNKENKD